MISFLFHQLVQQNFTRSSLTNAQNQHRVCNNWAPAIETNSYIFAHREVAAVAEIGSGSRQSLATATTATENESQLCSTHRGDGDKQLPSFHIIASAIRGDDRRAAAAVRLPSREAVQMTTMEENGEWEKSS
jgi:hypothetical protein